MFGVRLLLVGLGFFGVLYCLLSLVVACIWRCVRLLRLNRASTMANTLFLLRVLPLAGSAFVTLVFAVPAFVLLESGTIDEDLGTLAFGVGAILIIAAAVFRVMSTRARTSRVVGEWVEGAETLDAGTTTPTLQAKSGTPPLLLVGISEPRVLVSETAVALLNGDELRVAVRHEIEHMRSRDNLKKLVVHCAPFRGMAGLENAWYEATELAADHEAVSNSDEAVDLAAALLKLSELAPVQEAPTLTTGLMTDSMLVKLRVERLLNWNASEARGAATGLGLIFISALVLASGFYATAHYGRALLLVHQATEWFVH